MIWKNWLNRKLLNVSFFYSINNIHLLLSKTQLSYVRANVTHLSRKCKYHMPLTMCDAYTSHVRALSQNAPHMTHTMHALRASLAVQVACLARLLFGYN